MLNQKIIAYVVNVSTLLAVSTIAVIFVRKRKNSSLSQSEEISADKIPEKAGLISEVFGVFLALSLSLSLINYFQRQ